MSAEVQPIEFMTGDPEPEAHAKWNIKVAEEGKEVEKLIDSDPSSEDDLSQFVIKAIEGLNRRLDKLRWTEFRSHGVRRGKVERRQVISARSPLIEEAKRHLAVLKGREDIPIKFIRIDDKIEGFEILNHRDSKEP